MRNRLLSGRYRNDGNSVLPLNGVQLAAIRELNQKLSDGAYVCEAALCECGANDDDIIAEKDRYGIQATTVICRKCGLSRLNPRMTAKSYQSFYNSEYRKIYVGSKIPTEDFFAEQYERGKKLYSFLSKHIDMRSADTVCEIGCGAGGVLKYFQDKEKKCVGVDFGEEYLDYGRKNGVEDIHAGGIDVLVERGVKADIVLLVHVFEHFIDLCGELEKIKSLMHESSVVLIEVPGIYMVEKIYGDFLIYLQNAHTYNFTRNTLDMVLSNCGFSPLYSDENVRSLYRLSEHLDTMRTNSEEYEKITLYLRKIERFRHYYALRLHLHPKTVLYRIKKCIFNKLLSKKNDSQVEV